MGWSGGSNIACDMIKCIKKNVKDEKVKFNLYTCLIKSLENEDWDTEDEAMGVDKVFDKAMLKLNPDWTDIVKDNDE